jgi:hypothetical protein
VVDVDLTGVVCGRTCELATKGYLPIRKDGERGHARGRQIARATTAQYNEILVDRVYEGRVQLSSVRPL